MKADGSTAQFRTADDVFEEAAIRLGKQPAVDSSSTEIHDTLVLPQDIIDLWSLKCIRKAIRGICDIKGSSSCRNQPFLNPLIFYLDISTDIVVYRFSPTKLNEYLRKKIVHLETCAALESRTIVRELAKDGLMEDGREELLHRTLTPAFSFFFVFIFSTSRSVGRIRSCCDLLAQYLPSDFRNTLFASYE